MKLSCSSSLARLLEGDDSAAARRTLDIDVTCWCDLIARIQESFPRLGSLILTDAGELSPAFVLAVNDEVTHGPLESLKFGADDEVFVFAALAGG